MAWNPHVAKIWRIGTRDDRLRALDGDHGPRLARGVLTFPAIVEGFLAYGFEAAFGIAGARGS